MLAQFTALLPQLFGGVFFSAVVIGITLIFTFITYLMWTPIISPHVFPDDDRELPNEETMYNWWRFYTHPLVVSKHGAAGKSTSSPNLDNMTSFMGTSMFGGSSHQNDTKKNSFAGDYYSSQLRGKMANPGSYMEMENLGKV